MGKDDEIEVFQFGKLGDKTFSEGIIQGYGYTVYGDSVKFVPVYKDTKPQDRELLKRILKERLEKRRTP